MGKFCYNERGKYTGDCDKPLSPALMCAVEEWWGVMPQLSAYRIPQWMGVLPNVPVKLHVFADASEQAYGCCVNVVTQQRSELVYA